MLSQLVVLPLLTRVISLDVLLPFLPQLLHHFEGQTQASEELLTMRLFVLRGLELYDTTELHNNNLELPQVLKDLQSKDGPEARVHFF